MNNRLLSASCALLTVLSLSSAACREMTMPPADVQPTDATANDRPDPSDVQGNDVQNPPTDGGMDGGGSTNVTLRQLQDITDPAHPMANARVNLVQSDLVALTPRLLVGSSRMVDQCRWVVWVGTGAGGDFGGIQVQELVPRGAAADCFEPSVVGKIPADIMPGARITSVTNANFNEFCAGPTGINRAMCRNYEQSQLFLGAATAAVNVMGSGGTATPADVSVAAVGQGAMGVLGMRTLPLEGALIRIPMSNVRVTMSVADGGASFTTYALVDPTDSTRSLEVQISNFTQTTCARNFFSSRNGMSTGAVTGILVPDFGVWKVRIRDAADVQGLDCNTDGGAPMDASSSGG
ncbi:MAG: hypothetical protein JNK05_21465 [Myxococcales bacterium]|nr:hypothetical protein [Myxococcales bacterium]